MQHVAVLALLLLAVLPKAHAEPTAAAILSHYVEAIGGERALRAVKTRITEGTFDNGRGMNAHYRIVEEAPNKRVTLLDAANIPGASGSGRGFDGTSGWDNSFIGSGLRALEGRELADAARDADLLLPLHLLDACATTSVEPTADVNVVVCHAKAGNTVKHSFDKRSGVLIGQVVEGTRSVRVSYEDYRAVDGVSLPFKTRIEVAGATIRYDVSAIRHNQPVDRQLFQRPASND